MTDFLAKFQERSWLCWATMVLESLIPNDIQRPAQTNDSLLGLMKVVAGFMTRCASQGRPQYRCSQGFCCRRRRVMTGCNERGGGCVLGFWFVGSLLCFFILVLSLSLSAVCAFLLDFGSTCLFQLLKVLHLDKS